MQRVLEHGSGWEPLASRGTNTLNVHWMWKTILANTCSRVLNGELNDRKQKVDMNKQLTEIYRAINIKSHPLWDAPTPTTPPLSLSPGLSFQECPESRLMFGLPRELCIFSLFATQILGTTDGFIHPLTYWRISGRFPVWGHDKQSCHKHLCLPLAVDTSFCIPG